MTKFNDNWSFERVPLALVKRSKPVELGVNYYGVMLMAYALTIAFLLGGTL